MRGVSVARGLTILVSARQLRRACARQAFRPVESVRYATGGLAKSWKSGKDDEDDANSIMDSDSSLGHERTRPEHAVISTFDLFRYRRSVRISEFSTDKHMLDSIGGELHAGILAVTLTN